MTQATLQAPQTGLEGPGSPTPDLVHSALTERSRACKQGREEQDRQDPGEEIRLKEGIACHFFSHMVRHAPQGRTRSRES